LESNWRYNVWFHGLSMSGVDMIARDAVLENIWYLYSGSGTSNPYVTWAVVSASGQIPVPFRTDFFTRGYRFPDLLPPVLPD